MHSRCTAVRVLSGESVHTFFVLVVLHFSRFCSVTGITMTEYHEGFALTTTGQLCTSFLNS